MKYLYIIILIISSFINIILSQDKNDNLFLIEKDGKYGFINNFGDIVIKPEYDGARDFENDATIVSIAGSLSVLLKNGLTFPIDSLYSSPNTHGFSNGYCLIYDYNNACFYNTSGKRKKCYQEALDFWEGIAAVKIDDKWGYIDTTFHIIISPEYESASIFREDHAWVKKDGKCVILNRDGKLKIIEISNTNMLRTCFNIFSNGLAMISSDDKCGYINFNGDVIIQPKFETGSDFSEGLAAVQIENKYGFIDTLGNIIIDPQFDYVKDFSEGLAPVSINYEWGYINKEGEFVIDIQFSGANCFSNGLAKVWYEDGIQDHYSFDIIRNFDYIDKSGKKIYSHK